MYTEKDFIIVFGTYPGPNNYNCIQDEILQLQDFAMSTRRSSRVSLPRIFEGYVTKFAPHKALRLIARGKLHMHEAS